MTVLQLAEKNEPFQFDPVSLWMMMENCICIQVLHWQETRSFWMDRNRQNMARCDFELDPSDMLTVLNGPSYIGVAGERNPSVLLMRDILSLKQAPCVNLMVHTISFTAQ